MTSTPLPPSNASSSSGQLATIQQRYGITPGQAPSGSGSGAKPTATYIYLGKKQLPTTPDFSSPLNGKASEKAYGHNTGPVLGDLNTVMKEFANASIADQREMAALLAMAGYTGQAVDLSQINEYVQSTTLPDIEAAYANLLQDAASRYGAGQSITPNQLLQNAIKYRLHAAGVDWHGSLNDIWDNKSNSLKLDLPGTRQSVVPKDGQTKTLTSTSVSRDIMDPQDAKGLTRAMLQQELGRDPTQAEFEDFVAMLQHAQHANPSTSTTSSTQRYDASLGQWVSAGSNTTTHSGISAQGLQELAQEKAQQNPDWAEWQAVGTYAPALFNALGATVSGVGG